MVEQLPYSATNESVGYGLQLQTPSYKTEFPNDFPYDPGATSSLFELNYLPSNGIPFYIYPVIAALLGVVLYFLFKRVGKFRELLSLGLSASLIFAFLGPLNLPSIFHFRTVLGLSKFFAAVLFIALCVQSKLEKRSLSGFATKSFIPLSLFIISQLLSVFTLSNMSYFLTDFGILMTGILFMLLSYNYFSC